MLADMTDHADEFRKQAEEYRQVAATAPNDRVRASWLRLAGDYLKLAQFAL